MLAGAHIICYPGAFNVSTSELLWEDMQTINLETKKFPQSSRWHYMIGVLNVARLMLY